MKNIISNQKTADEVTRHYESRILELEKQLDVHETQYDEGELNGKRLEILDSVLKDNEEYKKIRLDLEQLIDSAMFLGKWID